MDAIRDGTYDAIVVGLGAMGSSAAYQLAKRGVRVLGLEAFEPGHTQGSSHGESRIIRMAYMEHPDYVPLLRRAYELWAEVQAESGADLFHPIGGLFVGSSESRAVAGALESARIHALPHELLHADEIAHRYPALRPEEYEVGVWEASAGVLFPERCIAAYASLASSAGADLRYGEAVRSWKASGGGVEVATDRGTYRADRLVLAAGAWMGRLLEELRLPLRAERMAVYWFHPSERAELFASDRFPIYIWDMGAHGSYYGFPHLERPGVKVGRHHTGRYVDLDAVERETTLEDEAELRRFTSRRIPALDGPVAESVVCLYTNTPDEDFIVDAHPEHPQVVYASACSGHGFKFASVIGEVLADLALEGRATPAAAFLRAERLAFTPGQERSRPQRGEIG